MPVGFDDLPVRPALLVEDGPHLVGVDVGVVLAGPECATVNGRTSEVEFGGSSAGALTGYANERLSLKWAVPVNEVELIGNFFLDIFIYYL